MIERFHWTLKAALMCNNQRLWPKVLPTVLLGLRTAIKKDLQASPSEMLFGTTLRLPEEFFTSRSLTANLRVFLNRFQNLMQNIYPVPASDHSSRHPFQFRDLETCSHVFKRVDTIRRPLEPPYTGPHPIVTRLNPKVFVILVDGVEKTVLTDCLKPAFSDVGDAENESSFSAPDSAGSGPSQPSESALSAPSPPSRTITFASPSEQLSRGGVDCRALSSPLSSLPSNSPAWQRELFRQLLLTQRCIISWMMHREVPS
ncbi:hypothetical protein PUN28_002093 [Cardiocondyla obscurior]|uniref:Uncharacterized protein n=1 Tax=Cardiocondyla obscurior TaxID=286306 RepID=A0AAW2GSK5_9HYME